MTTQEREIIKAAVESAPSPFFPRPIRNKKMYGHFLGITDFLLHSLAMGQFSGKEREAVKEYVGVVAHFLEEYEKQHFPKSDADAHDLLHFLMEQSHSTQIAMAEILGTSQPVVSELLKGKRKLTADHIERLSKQFKLSPSLFFSHAA